VEEAVTSGAREDPPPRWVGWETIPVGIFAFAGTRMGGMFG
jgi:hypothetical protein